MRSECNPACGKGTRDSQNQAIRSVVHAERLRHGRKCYAQRDSLKESSMKGWF